MINGDIDGTFICFEQFKIHVSILEQDKSSLGICSGIADMFQRIEHMLHPLKIIFKILIMKYLSCLLF